MATWQPTYYTTTREYGDKIRAVVVDRNTLRDFATCRHQHRVEWRAVQCAMRIETRPEEWRPIK
jgi:hypothetical protein